VQINSNDVAAMVEKTLSRKLKLAKIKKVRPAPRWADIKKFGLKHARTRRIQTDKKRWKRTKLRI
jgi:hypothetical protein